ncbi:avidin [Chiloscyllium plagiosum]|uniref:avidin n=1 Tax=Chiloscyllium plagiosum TaxID=36176 RepID=UPI001CB7CD2F|nr:avidin [Chiloscyllium plagiosum]
MERRIFAISLFLVAFFAPGILAGVCNMTGLWQNDLGSVLNLNEIENYKLKGKFLTAVEAAKGEAGSDRRARVIGIKNNGKEPTFSMSVAWAGGSITSWVGQCLMLEDGQQILRTTWLLRSPATNLLEDWKTTRIGQDTFHQINGDIPQGIHQKSVNL